MNTSPDELAKTYILVDIRERDAGGEVDVFDNDSDGDEQDLYQSMRHSNRDKKRRTSKAASTTSRTGLV